MPAWLTVKLFWKVAPYLGGALALLAAVWYLDHRGYQRAMQEAEARDNERKLQVAEFTRVLEGKTRDLEGSMQDSINDSDMRLLSQIAGIETVNKTIIKPTLVKEIQSDARFSDPAAGITDGMLREVNRARGFSQYHSCPAGSNAVACFDLPDPQPATGQVNRDSGQ